MSSQALNRLTTIHGEHLKDVIEIINDAPTEPKTLLMQRLLVVGLVAFWEVFHEELCRESLAFHPNPPETAEQRIKGFHNPEPKKITCLYNNVLGIHDITESWWGNFPQKTGKTPDEFRATIQRMIKLRHDTAHGIWGLPLSPKDCQDFLVAVLLLAVRTDKAVHAHFQTSKEKRKKRDGGAESA